MVVAATSLLLAGCGGGAPSPGADAPASPATTPGSTSSPTPSSTPSSTPGSKATSTPEPTDEPTGEPTDEPTESPSPSRSASASGSGAGSGLEMPEAPEPTVTSLAELLEDVRTDPLVTAPLPRAADARGRLATGFPAVLRPTRASRVDSSSVSPAGPRLQVALVGSTSLAPADVLMAYRTRLAGRGLTELAAPATSAGSEAAAFRRGRSVVTITVTTQGSGTGYSLHASLHTGGE
ncbi:hypothetical protein CXG46_18435 [Nocardioides alpinus]|uniref:Lipoprotein n=1 Tax=Nocardioides alpinus TaxID=748909 RepID=A0ABX4QRZ8_9ACTN|nr:hypothetical protein CXG46_18435 [Nocardioides alpinus]